MRRTNSKDFWAGAMFLAVGLFALIWSATYYRLGTIGRIGPGLFPTVLGAVLAILGAVILIRSLASSSDPEPVPPLHIRPLFLLLAVVAYGYLMEPLGLVIATAVLTVLSALCGHEFKWKEVTLLIAVLTIFSVLVFVKGLSLPFPVWPEALG